VAAVAEVLVAAVEAAVVAAVVAAVASDLIDKFPKRKGPERVLPILFQTLMVQYRSPGSRI